MKPISICSVDKLITKVGDYLSSHMFDEEKFGACCWCIAVTGYFAVLTHPVNTKHISDACKVPAECVDRTEAIWPLLLPEAAPNTEKYLDLIRKIIVLCHTLRNALICRSLRRNGPG
jgi:hypothetical protein